jgi:hypothetical protein
VLCYEDNWLLKLFSDIIKLMYCTYRSLASRLPFAAAAAAASQVLCYEDNRLLKLFSDIVKLMYNGDLVGEDTIQHWYKKGSHPKGRNVFLKVIIIIIIPCKPYLSASATAPHPLGRRKVERLFSLFSV